MEIKVNTGIGKPMAKLVEAISNGCYYLFQPTHLKRIAKAEGEAALIKQAFDFKSQLRQSIMDSKVEYIQSPRAQREINNIVDICGIATQELELLKSVSEKPVDPDWSSNFFDYAKKLDDEIKILWGKMLAGEIENPGTFFKRTLSVVKEIEKHEANWFVDISKYVINDSIISNIVPLKYYPYNQLQSLFDCRLFIQDGCGYEISDKDVSLVGKSIRLTFPNPEEKKISMDAYSMTDSGSQLYKLINTESDIAYFTELKESLEKRYHINIDMMNIIKS